MPAATQRSRSSIMAWAVIAMMGRWAPVPSSRARILAVASNPSISGIWQSMRTASKRSRATSCSASRPLPAMVTRAPAFSRILRATIRLISWSSTRRIRAFSAMPSGTAGPASEIECPRDQLGLRALAGALDGQGERPVQQVAAHGLDQVGLETGFGQPGGVASHARGRQGQERHGPAACIVPHRPSQGLSIHLARHA